MSARCVWIEGDRCYRASWEETREANKYSHPVFPYEFVLSAMDEGRRGLDHYVQSHRREDYPIRNTVARAASLPLAFLSAPLETGLSIATDTLPSLHAMAKSLINDKMTVGQVAAKVVVGIGDKAIAPLASFPGTCKEIAIGDHPATAANTWTRGAIDLGLIFYGGVGVVKGLSMVIDLFGSIGTVAEGAAIAVKNGGLGGGLRLATSVGEFTGEGVAVAATKVATTGGPFEWLGLAAQSGAVGGAKAPQDEAPPNTDRDPHRRPPEYEVFKGRASVASYLEKWLKNAKPTGTSYAIEDPFTVNGMTWLDQAGINWDEVSIAPWGDNTLLIKSNGKQFVGTAATHDLACELPSVYLDIQLAL